MDFFSIVSDSGPLVRHCVNLSCQGCELVHWKGLTACPTCGKIYGDDSDEASADDSPRKVAYGPAVDRREDEAMIAPLARSRIVAPGREGRKRTEFDDAFFQARGIVVLEDTEDLPLSIEQERKQHQVAERRPKSRQGDHGRTKSRSDYSSRPASY